MTAGSPTRHRAAAGAMRPRIAALLTMVSMVGLVLSGLTASAATAATEPEDRLEHEQGVVEQRLHDARGHLEHSSLELQRSIAALERAAARLGAARTHLAETRAELTKAVAFDQLMQRRLAAAQARLAQARANLAAGQAALGEQRDDAMAWAAENFQSPDEQLLELRVLLQARSASSLTQQMTAVESVGDKQADTVDELEANTVLLTVHEEEVRDAEQAVAVQRAEAASRLAVRQQLEAEAQRARNAVSDLVDERRAAQQRAAAARQADLRMIAQLEQERQRISARLQALAAQRAAERAAQLQAMAQAAAAASSQRVAQGVGQSNGLLTMPVNGYVTSHYGMRLHPILRYMKLHDGTDFGAACGTPIYAAAGGRVIERYYNGGYGNRIVIDHGVERGVSLATSYNHLSGYATSAGDTVAKGEVIGYVGTTGYSTGCHLHFMVYSNGRAVDPMGWL